ncbi:MAG: class I SAM-dependent methyltransferase [Candidatus Bathyarchaeota archaeon]|nr:class I SAM-dependent methyltransferase [Candidatus Bathyarchaeota archaeon]
MILDVGCGRHKRGDVGVDLSRNSLADVIADAHHLPFRDESLDIVISHHMIEHLKKPEHSVKEMLRISKGQVKIVCPHRFGHYAKIAPDHINFFNKRWFGRLAGKLNVKENVRTIFEPAIYFGLFGLFMRPSELVVEYRKTLTQKSMEKTPSFSHMLKSVQENTLAHTVTPIM